MTEYERERMAIIARNKERMKQLGLEKLAADIMPKAQPKPRSQQKGLGAKKKVTALHNSYAVYLLIQHKGPFAVRKAW